MASLEAEVSTEDNRMFSERQAEAGERLRPPEEVRRIARRLEEAGHSTWVVGGAVRDALAGLDPGDWDLTTAARPTEVRRLFRRTVPIGIEHGTVGVLGKDGRMYEVTTFRRDVETFGRHAVVAFADTLEEDLERRDFTINAVAYHPLTGELRDPHGGEGDLNERVLRTVGAAHERFAEDWLRVLRALRFAGRFGLTIAEETWRAAQDSADHLTKLSAERVREELMKVLGSRHPSAALELYRRSGVLAALYPELAACVGVARGGGEEVWTHLLRVTDALPPARANLRLAALLHDIGVPGAGELDHAAVGAARARGVLKRLKSSNALTDATTHLVAQHASFPPVDAPAPELRRWLRRVGAEYVNDLFRLRLAHCRAYELDRSVVLRLRERVRRMLRQSVALEIGDLAIGGAELRALGIPPGPLYGEILRDLLEMVTDDPALNTREALEAVVRTRIG
jgi:tRNA nucleotidyltransferase/poly(A) polymerase